MNIETEQQPEQEEMNNAETVIFRVDETSDLPIWAQLRNRIAYLIRTGYFKAGEQLPSVRSLAADARINYNTVTKAYRDLELGGLIISVRGRGMYVQKDAEVGGSEEEAIDALLDSCIAQYRSKGLTYQDVRERILAKVDALEQKAREAEEEKRDYGIVF